jgi:hypothetical protein
MSFLKKLFGQGAKAQTPATPGPSTKMEKLKVVFDLRKRQGWKGNYIQGELVAIMWLLEKEGKTPEEIVRATLQEDWPSFVASFV